MKRKAIIILGILILILVGVAGYFLSPYYTKHKMLAKINTIEKDFKDSADRESRLELLKSTIQELNDYNKSEKIFPEISEQYEVLISSMQKDFIQEYDSIIKENAPHDIGASDDIDTLTNHRENLNTLLTTIESEKEYTLPNDSDYQKYVESLSSLTEAYSNRISAIEEKQKAGSENNGNNEEETQKQTAETESMNLEEKTNTHYENEYFSVDVPAEWGGYWTIEEEDNSAGNIQSTIYTFSYNPKNDYGGGAMIYVLDMSDTSISLTTYASMLPSECEEIGFTSSGNHDVFKTEAGAGFFFDGGATITLK